MQYVSRQGRAPSLQNDFHFLQCCLIWTREGKPETIKFFKVDRAAAVGVCLIYRRVFVSKQGTRM